MGQRPPELNDLVADPASALEVADAVELAHVQDQRRTPLFDPPQDAFEGHIWGSQMPAAEIYVFYRQRLEASGWKPDTFGAFASTTETETWTWCRPGITFRLAFKKPNAYEPSLYKGQSFTTVFDATLVGRLLNVPCPDGVPPSRRP